MIYKELAQLIDYDIPYIEIYNEQGDVEYIVQLETIAEQGNVGAQGNLGLIYYRDGVLKAMV